jgi:hypothetical protein
VTEVHPSGESSLTPCQTEWRPAGSWSFLGTGRVSGFDHAVMSSGLATSWGRFLDELSHGMFGKVAAFAADLPSVLCSTRTAPARRNRAAGSGKTPTTSERRLLPC